MHFDPDSPTGFTSFIDADGGGNGIYDETSSELVQAYVIGKGNVIDDICATVSGADRCASDGSLSRLDVTFLRPEPDANILVNSTQLASEATIYLLSPKGLSKEVSVNSTGQIVIE